MQARIPTAGVGRGDYLMRSNARLVSLSVRRDCSRGLSLLRRILATMIVIAKCGVHRKAFGIQFVLRPHGIWEADNVLAAPENRDAGRGGSSQLTGSFTLGPRYPGCPFCDNESFYQCSSCGHLNCQGTAEVSAGRTYVRCGNCSAAGYIDGELDSLDAFEGI